MLPSQAVDGRGLCRRHCGIVRRPLRRERRRCHGAQRLVKLAQQADVLNQVGGKNDKVAVQTDRGALPIRGESCRNLLLQQDGEEGLQIHIAEIVREVERAQTAPQCVLPEGEPLQAL